MKAIDNNGILECEYLFKDVEKLHGRHIDSLNYVNMPITAYRFTDDNVRMFNHIISCFKSAKLKKIVRTPSGAVSTFNGYYPAYDVRVVGGSIEITVINVGGSFRLQWRNSSQDLFSDNKMTMSGHMAFNIFKDLCKRYKIDLNKYAHLNKQQALEEKQQIEKAIISVVSDKFIDREWDNVHHIDWHSSYMSGLVKTHPEFADVVNYIYNNRKKDDLKYKAVLNMTQGYMQSQLCGYKFAHLSRDMIKNNNDRIRDICNKLIKSKRIPLLINTDGVWYQGDMYHDENEGTGLCTWGHDHINCRLRIKSSGAYEYIENGKYYPVVRGYTNLDKIKPREEWQWGDIYQDECEEIKYQYKDEYIFIDGVLEGEMEYETI